MEKFFAEQARKSEKKPGREEEARLQQGGSVEGGGGPKKLPKGVVLGKDGKPCRTCTSVADWLALTKRQPSQLPTSSSSSTTTTATAVTASTSLTLPDDCPPDVETLGNHTWTLLHSISASYPPVASPAQQSEMKQFLGLFAKLYPCWVCADDFRDWMAQKGNEPRVEGRQGLGKWMCEAHNEVNRKLGKEEFDCGKWEERWRTGWRDGRCD